MIKDQTINPFVSEDEEETPSEEASGASGAEETPSEETPSGE